MKVLNMLKDDSNLDIKNLSKIIETDAALTAQVIRISNSPLLQLAQALNPFRNQYLL